MCLPSRPVFTLARRDERLTSPAFYFPRLGLRRPSTLPSDHFSRDNRALCPSSRGIILQFDIVLRIYRYDYC